MLPSLLRDGWCTRTPDSSVQKTINPSSGQAVYYSAASAASERILIKFAIELLRRRKSKWRKEYFKLQTLGRRVRKKPTTGSNRHRTSVTEDCNRNQPWGRNSRRGSPVTDAMEAVQQNSGHLLGVRQRCGCFQTCLEQGGQIKAPESERVFMSTLVNCLLFRVQDHALTKTLHECGRPIHGSMCRCNLYCGFHHSMCPWSIYCGFHGGAGKAADAPTLGSK